MKIVSLQSWVERFELTRPYAIAFRSVDSVQNFVVVLRSDRGHIGLGAASPEPHVTGETPEACGEALREDALSWLVGRDPRALPAHCRELERRMPQTPAARAAVDMALHDLLARYVEVPLVEMLGRAHESLPTSITIGIKPVDDTLREAREYLERGFRILKVKLGHSMDEDIERLRALRRSCGAEIILRVDANQGYAPDAIMRFVDATRDLGVEFMEQPVPVDGFHTLRGLPEAVRRRVAADESLLDERDAVRLLEPPRPCGVFNIKLMKCGGVRSGLRIATIAEAAGIELMWGCMDESIISISAALHAAFASPATRYLDLDGSLDLARDVAEGGFVLENGVMRTTDGPGLGVKLID